MRSRSRCQSDACRHISVVISGMAPTSDVSVTLPGSVRMGLLRFAVLCSCWQRVSDCGQANLQPRAVNVFPARRQEAAHRKRRPESPELREDPS